MVVDTGVGRAEGVVVGCGRGVAEHCIYSDEPKFGSMHGGTVVLLQMKKDSHFGGFATCI